MMSEATVPQALPYLPSYKNLGELFNKIQAAMKPETFTHAFLRDTIGLKGTNDRPLIAFLRTLGFLDVSSRPTPAYDLLKNPLTAKSAIAEGIRTAYAPLFKANEKANGLPPDALKGLISQVAGTDQDMTNRVAATFTAAVKHGDFTGGPPKTISEPIEEPAPAPDETKSKLTALRTEFHYNIQIHLPANGSEETYLNIFNALRKTFK
jgi:hypothetical protein